MSDEKRYGANAKFPLPPQPRSDQVVVYDKEGVGLRCSSIDAKDHIASGEYTAEPPAPPVVEEPPVAAEAKADDGQKKAKGK